MPIGEYFPYESIKTNVLGTQNIIRAIIEVTNHVSTMLAVSTDKACLPVNTYGMCKALEERLTVEANRQAPDTRFIGVRYGNVAASRGSVIPIFLRQIAAGGPITVTDPEMTRFLISMDESIDLIFAALSEAMPGELYVADSPSFRLIDLAEAMIDQRDIDINVIGSRPGDTRHEWLVSEEEIQRTIKRGNHLVIMPVFPDRRSQEVSRPILKEGLSSTNNLLSVRELKRWLDQLGI